MAYFSHKPCTAHYVSHTPSNRVYSQICRVHHSLVTFQILRVWLYTRRSSSMTASIIIPGGWARTCKTAWTKSYDRGPTTINTTFTDRKRHGAQLYVHGKLSIYFILPSDIQRHKIPPICNIYLKQQLQSSHGESSPLSNPLLHHPIHL